MGLFCLAYGNRGEKKVRESNFEGRAGDRPPFDRLEPEFRFDYLS